METQWGWYSTFPSEENSKGENSKANVKEILWDAIITKYFSSQK